DASTGRGGGTWSDDGNIIFTPQLDSGLMRVSAAGGTPQPLTQRADSSRRTSGFHRWPQLLPGGKRVLLTIRATPFNWEDADIAIVSLVETDNIKIVQHGGYFGRYLMSPYSKGHLLYVHESTLFAVPFDLDRLETSGTPVPFLVDVAANSMD